MVDGASGGARPPPSCIRTWAMAGFKIQKYFKMEEGPKVVKSDQMSVPGPSEIAKTLILIGKTHMRKPNAQNLINPVEMKIFEPKLQNGLENDQKALRL